MMTLNWEILFISMIYIKVLKYFSVAKVTRVAWLCTPCMAPTTNQIILLGSNRHINNMLICFVFLVSTEHKALLTKVSQQLLETGNRMDFLDAAKKHLEVN